jgi:hypothetical protein
VVDADGALVDPDAMAMFLGAAAAAFLRAGGGGNGGMSSPFM